MKIISPTIICLFLFIYSQTSNLTASAEGDYSTSSTLHDLNIGVAVAGLASGESSDITPLTLSNIYNNTSTVSLYYSGGNNIELLDFGTSVGGEIRSFTFGYATTENSPSCTIRFYSGTTSATCPGTLLATFNFTGLSGHPGPGNTSYTSKVTLTPGEYFTLPEGNFGYSYEFGDNSSGPLIAFGGSGQVDQLYKGACLSFGVTNAWASIYMSITADIVIPPGNLTISGYKFNDVNNDGIWGDLNVEPGIENWVIYIDANANGLLDPTDPKTITDVNGYYAFTGLDVGTYVINEGAQVDWVQTYPASLIPSSMAMQAKGVPPKITTTTSLVTIYSNSIPVVSGGITPATVQSSPLIHLDLFRADPLYNTIDGVGYSVAILDTGVDMDHPFFGSRIVYAYDFADGDSSAEATEAHGSNVAGIVGSEDGTYSGMAPGCNLIILKVFKDGGTGNFGYIESALQWCVTNGAAYNLVSLNMSLGDTENYQTPQSLYGIDDELANLKSMGIAICSSSGNSFETFGSVTGVSYPAADVSSLSVGAVYDANIGGVTYTSGAEAFTTAIDRLTPFSQRHLTLSTIFAPGAAITNAGLDGATVSYHGTSQAAPHIAGIAVLAQEVAETYLGRMLTVDEYSAILQTTATFVNDGDDEDDNVTNTGLSFPRVDVLAMANAIVAMAIPGSHQVVLGNSDVANVNFGNYYTGNPQCGDWGYDPMDLNLDCYVNLIDFTMFVGSWLKCTDPDGVDCVNLN